MEWIFFTEPEEQDAVMKALLGKVQENMNRAEQQAAAAKPEVLLLFFLSFLIP